MHRHRPGLENITAALLLPIVPTIVASGTGGIVAEALPNPHHAFTTIIVSYVSWGIGSSFTACVLALYFHRLTIHSIPSKEAVVSSLLPVGPMGQGAFAIQQLGKVALHVIPRTNAFGEVGARAGEVLHVMGVFVGLVMYGFGLIWLSFALISIITTRPRFNMGYWGFTFPLGTLATSANNLAGTLDSNFFRVATMIVSLAVTFLWMVIATKTATVAISGELFHAPCLKDLQEKPQVRESGKVV
ncbi:malic acid transporter [Fusarium heterosporum]|uniref:Malic acid transporter n=1 Tax=Fusarium heterosporum TaxID=42747 RepID=A0A8H5T8Z9_FUSHE|nr:malic acid transporter [Fusarium heterosporum]